MWVRLSKKHRGHYVPQSHAFTPMNTQNPDLGECPHCSCEILSRHILIEYEGGVWAECPDCQEVVAPE